MRTVFLDYDTVSNGDLDASQITRIVGDVCFYPQTADSQIAERIVDAEVVLSNKVKLPRARLEAARALKLIALAATGTDNVDLAAAQALGIAVCNVRAYCTSSVVQHAWSMILSLTQHLPEYARLADRTRHDYDLVFNYLKPLDRMPMVQLDTAAVIGIRDKAFAQKKRRFANYVLQVLGVILGWGRLHKLAPVSNPAHGIPKIPRPRDLPRANRPWNDAETDAVLEAAQGGLRVAISLAVYAGMRGGDIVRVTVAVAPRDRAQARDVGAARGLGDRERRDLLSGEYRGDHASFQFFGPEDRDRR